MSRKGDVCFNLLEFFEENEFAPKLGHINGIERSNSLAILDENVVYEKGLNEKR